MNIQLYKAVIGEGLVGIGDISYHKGDVVDLGEALWFELDNTSYSRLHGGVVEQSNQRVLIREFDERGINYQVKRWSFGGRSLVIDANLFYSEYVQNLIGQLDGYPVLDEEDYLNLSDDLTKEFLKRVFDGYRFEDVYNVYLSILDSADEGVIFESGSKPYLDKSFYDDMLDMLNNIEVKWERVDDFLEFLDGWGIIYEDDELVKERLKDYAGVCLTDKLIIKKEV